MRVYAHEVFERHELAKVLGAYCRAPAEGTELICGLPHEHSEEFHVAFFPTYVLDHDGASLVPMDVMMAVWS